MATMAEIQKALLPAAVGTCGIVYSTIMGMMTMGKVRYGEKMFAHPYKPWSDDHNDKEGKHYRGFKACQNCVEWTVYALPALWLNVLYTPALVVIPTIGPVIADWAPMVGGATAIVYSYYNAKYVEGYMESADGRLKPFYARTSAFKFLFYGALAGIGVSLATHTGLVDLVKTKMA